MRRALGELITPVKRADGASWAGAFAKSGEYIKVRRRCMCQISPQASRSLPL